MPDDHKANTAPDGDSSEHSHMLLTVGQLRDDYYEATGTLSENIPKFCFAGIAIIWIFKMGDKPGGLAPDKDLTWGLGAFVIALVSDIFQHVWKAIVLRRYLNKCRAANKTEDDEAGIPKWVNEGTDYGFWLKILITLAGYGILCRHIAGILTR